MDGRGIKEFMDTLIKFVPNSKTKEYKGTDAKDAEVIRKCDPAAPASAFVFKTIADPFVGKINLLKVISGKLTSGMELFNTRVEKPEKLGALFFMRGKSQAEADSVSAGDIVAAAKLQFTQTGDTLCDKANIIKYPPVDFPEPFFTWQLCRRTRATMKR
jgi:elongation factor G